MLQDSHHDQTLFAPDGPAKETPWLESVVEWLMHEAACGGKSSAYFPSYLPSGFLEKTSLAFCPSAGEGIGLPYSGTWQSAGMGMPGACLTFNTSESPKGGGVCSLSAVLETQDVPRKYYLSPKACLGILRRAEKRGRELPIALQNALAAAATEADSEPNRESISSRSKKSTGGKAKTKTVQDSESAET